MEIIELAVKIGLQWMRNSILPKYIDLFKAQFGKASGIIPEDIVSSVVQSIGIKDVVYQAPYIKGSICFKPSGGIGVNMIQIRANVIDSGNNHGGLYMQPGRQDTIGVYGNKFSQFHSPTKTLKNGLSVVWKYVEQDFQYQRTYKRYSKGIRHDKNGNARKKGQYTVTYNVKVKAGTFHPVFRRLELPGLAIPHGLDVMSNVNEMMTNTFWSGFKQDFNTELEQLIVKYVYESLGKIMS